MSKKFKAPVSKKAVEKINVSIQQQVAEIFNVRAKHEQIKFGQLYANVLLSDEYLIPDLAKIVLKYTDDTLDDTREKVMEDNDAVDKACDLIGDVMCEYDRRKIKSKAKPIREKCKNISKTLHARYDHIIKMGHRGNFGPDGYIYDD